MMPRAGPRPASGPWRLAFAQALPSPGSRARVRAGARRQAGLPHRARVRPPLGADGRGRPRACPDRASGHGQDLRSWLPGQLLDPRRQGAARDQRLQGGNVLWDAKGDERTRVLEGIRSYDLGVIDDLGAERDSSTWTPRLSTWWTRATAAAGRWWSPPTCRSRS